MFKNAHEHIDIGALKPHPENYRKHPEEQIKHIIASIKEHGIYRDIVVSRDDYILAGHGVTEALKIIGVKDVPVIRVNCDHDSPQAKKIIVGDNHISNLAETDTEALKQLLHGIDDTDELLGTGFNQDIMEHLNSHVDIVTTEHIQGSQEEGKEEVSELYTRKIESPVYIPTGEKPTIKDLYDSSKMTELCDKIEKSNIDDHLKIFLMYAAQRHTQFNYKNIAEYYAHSSKEVQELMEDSALVIIDFNKAIEDGFVEMNKSIRDRYVQEQA